MKARGQALDAVQGLLAGGPGHRTRFPADPRADTVLARKGKLVFSYLFDAELSVREGCHVFRFGREVGYLVGDGKPWGQRILDLDALAEGGGL